MLLSIQGNTAVSAATQQQVLQVVTQAVQTVEQSVKAGNFGNGISSGGTPAATVAVCRYACTQGYSCVNGSCVQMPGANTNPTANPPTGTGTPPPSPVAQISCDPLPVIPGCTVTAFVVNGACVYNRACQPTSTAQTPAVAAPSISSVTPSTGSPGTLITVNGSGFLPGENAINIAGGAISSTYVNGNTLTFIAPSSIFANCPQSGSIGCSGTIMDAAGSYPITVTNANGTSNAVSLSIGAAVIVNCDPLPVIPGCTVTASVVNNACVYNKVCQNQTSTASTAAPVISALTPSSGPIGSQVTIAGSGFAPTGNTVHFDVYTFPSVAAANNGTSLAFTVPPTVYYNYCPQNSMCPNFVINTAPGAHTVNVSNANGTSNSVTFTVTAAGTTTVTPQ